MANGRIFNPRARPPACHNTRRSAGRTSKSRVEQLLAAIGWSSQIRCQLEFPFRRLVPRTWQTMRSLLQQSRGQSWPIGRGRESCECVRACNTGLPPCCPSSMPSRPCSQQEDARGPNCLRGAPALPQPDARGRRSPGRSASGFSHSGRSKHSFCAS